MNIPSKFKEVISNTFYDKSMEIWKADKTEDDEGSIIDGALTKVEDLTGNFQTQTKERIQKEYGLDIEANAVITCDTTQAVEDNILMFNNKGYRVKGVLKRDSHTVILVYMED
ncbi:MAG: hypothetical protein LBL91_06290 [Lachnospiraceae bacterium]|nr:hypothetical protein [Lachnospiraceae bacterium]